MTKTAEKSDRPFIVRIRKLGLNAGIQETLQNAPLTEILTSHNVKATEEELRSEVEQGLREYVWHGPYGMHRAIKAKAMPRKKRLQEMAKLAEVLKGEYDYFVEDIGHFIQMCAASKGISVSHSDAENPALKEIEESLDTPFVLSELLTILPDAIAYELAYKHPDIPGRPKEKGLRYLILSLAEFWERHQGRDFTVDHHAGAAVSDSLAFVRDCVLALDEVPEKAVISASRAVRDYMIAYKKHDHEEIPFLSADW